MSNSNKIDSPNAPAPTSNEEHIVVAVMGPSGAGKSTFINLASGSKLRVGDNLASETKKVDIASYEYGGHTIVLVDTPGFDDTERSDTDTLNLIATWLDATYRSNKLLSGIIYLHRITDNRIGGINYKNIQLFHKLCGKDAMHNVVLCTTMWDLVPEDQGASREQQLASDFWKPMIEEGARIARHDGTPESAQKNINSLSNLERIALSIQESLAEGKTLLETEAGMEINKELIDMQEKHKRDLDETKRDMEEAIRENDNKAQGMVNEERARLETKLEEEKQQQAELSSARTEEIATLQHSIDDMKDRHEREVRESREAGKAEGHQESPGIKVFTEIGHTVDQVLSGFFGFTYGNTDPTKWVLGLG